MIKEELLTEMQARLEVALEYEVDEGGGGLSSSGAKDVLGGEHKNETDSLSQLSGSRRGIYFTCKNGKLAKIYFTF